MSAAIEVEGLGRTFVLRRRREVEGVAGPAARAGIEAGDVLLAINGKPVQSIEQVKAVMQGKPKSVALLVQRDGEKIFVPVNLG